MKATFKKYSLDFKIPGGTSRGVLHSKETWFIILNDGHKWGIGECNMFRGLSYDDVPQYEEKLQWVVNHIEMDPEMLRNQLVQFPSIQFGLEQAFLSLESQDPFVLFDSGFIHEKAPIPINGLIWMGNEAFMWQQIEEKLQAGFTCLKMKIGAIAIDTELALLQKIRNRFSKEQITLRVDANGAFTPEGVTAILDKLAALQVHSIEQPIKAGNWAEMARLCERTPLPIAMDEELIGILSLEEKREMLLEIRPQYIILKPSLIGGFKGSLEWIGLANELGIGWWVTSALESNIGLNAIAQWTATLPMTLPQGLGTGSLFTNNIGSPLEVVNGGLYYRKEKKWDTALIQQLCT